MRKDGGNVREWCKHTRNCPKGRRQVNKSARKAAKRAIRKG